MKVLKLDAPPSSEVAAALDKFEREFNYPLGTHDTFRISHGEDYSLFFRAMGEGVSFAVQHDGRILGTIGIALRPMRLADGTSTKVAYLGDLKMSTSVPKTGFVLLALFRSALTWAVENGATRGYGVVMTGTKKTPSEYTGRSFIPSFAKVQDLVVLRIPTGEFAMKTAEAVTESMVDVAFERLTGGVHLPKGDLPAMRSKFVSMPLLTVCGQACGLLEDTMLAKRLFSSTGDELRSAHLSRFAFAKGHETGAVEVLEHALAVSAARGFPAMFVAVSQDRYAELKPHIAHLNAIEAPATVFAYGFSAGDEFLINTAEI